jgi:chitin disaccharide deacetylase
VRAARRRFGLALLVHWAAQSETVTALRSAIALQNVAQFQAAMPSRLHSGPNTRRLIVNADDFGRSPSINRAVIQAHQRGILTTASLMVNGDAAEEAVALAHEHPCLGVGLHLTLSHGSSALPHAQIPDLIDTNGNFANNAPAAGFKYFAKPRCHAQLEREIAAQFEHFRATSLTLDHVNGHLQFHLHPTVFKILCRRAHEFGIRQMRVTHDPLRFHTKLGSGRWPYSLSHAFIFKLLSSTARGRLRALKIKSTDHVFGLMQNALVDETYIRKLLPELPPGDSELYSHPSLDEFKHEYDALVSPAVRDLVERLGIKLIRYADL